VERAITFAEDVELFLDELLIILSERHYFSFWEDASLYVKRIVLYAVQYIGVLQGKNAPFYFNRYGSNLKYITYRANKTTSWYIFYQQQDNIYLIRHITNNHVAAQYIE
jgi:hypothetical protein